ncbi:hypothetical protein EIP86_005291 [Pleurotus ostreatoroseus]|nr:hypothetical protein EIP86_005291 [Pleurotus ostreatoroseus]
MPPREQPLIRIAESPFRPEDDPTADFVLQTSDKVRFWLCKAVLARASPIFKDMFTVPHPPQAAAAAAAAANANADDDYVDGKPIVRVTEKAAVVDPFVRCCYPVARPVLDSKLLTAMYEAGEKYEADGVRAYARQEVARRALEPEHCLRAYLVAYRFGMTEEMKTAARQTINVPKQDIVQAELPEHRTVPATAITRLLKYRARCIDAVAKMCTPQGCFDHYEGQKKPLWIWLGYSTNYGRPPETECTCPWLDEHFSGVISDWDIHPSESAPSPEDCPPDSDFDYAIKYWFNRYLWDLSHSVLSDDKPIRQALMNPAGLALAMERVHECKFKPCHEDSSKALVNWHRELEERLEETISNVSM